MYASTLPRSNWLRRASIRLAWYRHMPASSSDFVLWLEIVSHDGLDTGLRPAFSWLHYYYYYYYYFYYYYLLLLLFSRKSRSAPQVGGHPATSQCWRGVTSPEVPRYHYIIYVRCTKLLNEFLVSGWKRGNIHSVLEENLVIVLY